MPRILGPAGAALDDTDPNQTFGETRLCKAGEIRMPAYHAIADDHFGHAGLGFGDPFWSPTARPTVESNRSAI